MSHTINELRDHLFATLASLRDTANPMDIGRAKAISEVAQTVINTAKVEVEHMKVSGEMDGTGFIRLGNGNRDNPAQLGDGQSTADKARGTSTTVIGAITRHVAR